MASPKRDRPATSGPSPRGPDAGLGTAGPRPAVPRRPQPDGCAPARPSVQSRMMSSTASVSDPLPDTAGVGQPTPSDAPPGRFDTLTDTVPIAAIGFHFDPLLRLADTLAVRWQTIALATVIALALIVAGVAGQACGTSTGRSPVHRDRDRARRRRRRPDRLRARSIWTSTPRDAGRHPRSGYGRPGARARGGRWPADGVVRRSAARRPDRSMAAGRRSSRSCSPWAWASSRWSWAAVARDSRAMRPGRPPTSGPGPWSSLAPALPSHPSQAYEGIATLVAPGRRRAAARRYGPGLARTLRRPSLPLRSRRRGPSSARRPASPGETRPSSGPSMWARSSRLGSPPPALRRSPPSPSGAGAMGDLTGTGQHGPGSARAGG